MKYLKHLLFIILTLSLALSLFACGGNECKEHIDEDKDGKCDKCKEEVTAETAKVLLFENGIPTFRFVLGDDVSRSTKGIIEDYIDAMSDIDVEIELIKDLEENYDDCEILIGSVKGRGEKYTYDKYSLGNDGYIFKIIDGKIIITSGSNETLESAVEEFIEDVLMFDEDTTDYGTLYMENDQEVLEVQEYGITSLKLNGTDMRGYTLAYDPVNTFYKDTATYIRDTFYDKTGYWFEIVKLSEADASKSILLKQVERIVGEDGFKITAAESGQLIIECMYGNKLDDAVASFLTEKIVLASTSEINFTGEVYTSDISFLTYEEFGAKGDGKTDDFKALYETHIEANEYKQTVIAKDGAKYYIKENKAFVNNQLVPTSIPIKTNVVWTNATFIIDDTNLDMFNTEDRAMGNKQIFDVLSDYPVQTITNSAKLEAVLTAGLNRNTTKIDLGLGYPAMIIPYNDSHKVYRRKGYGGFQGGTMHEVIVVDKNGNVDLTSDAQTPIMFDYSHLDKIEVYRLDIEPITIKDGTVTHLGNRKDAKYVDENNVTREAGYISRGLNVTRSFTTVEGLVHNIENEISPKEYASTVTAKDNTGFQSAPYLGFFYATNATNITFKNCTLTGRRYYHVQGTYDFGANTVNKIVLDGCIQQNFWVVYNADADVIEYATRDTAGAVPSMAYLDVDGKKDRMHWGIGGTNFCKNMEYLNSTLSRYDAHSGLYNGKVINSVVSYLALTGNGDFIVEDVEWYAESAGAAIFPLRSDYGSTWEGNITVKNLKAYVDRSQATYVFNHYYANWYYGYKTFIPNISIDNLDYYDINTYDAIESGYEVQFIGSSIKGEPAMHLKTTQSHIAVYPYVDYDNDGLVDNTDMPYDKTSINSYWDGIGIPENYNNLNPVTPPSYVTIINNDGVNGAGGYKFAVPKTHGAAATADPDVTLPAGIDANGGFFGITKFTYGTGENEYYYGTNHTGTQTFVFK